MKSSDIPTDVFLNLRTLFFVDEKTPKAYSLRDKRNTQDDPLDEFIAAYLSEHLEHLACIKASGPLISPDMVVYMPAACNKAMRDDLRDDPQKIIAIEVKKLERQISGQVARSTGLDYNTTPPCGMVRVYDGNERPLDIKSFYLFLCQEKTSQDQFNISSLVLCDGNILNADFDLYLQIIGQRQKGIGLGTYGDGVNRNRPMLIFSNPLGAAQLDHHVTLVTSQKIENAPDDLQVVYEIGRTIPEGGTGIFYAYRHVKDIPREWEAERLVDPFPKPVKRQTATQARGKFRLPFFVEE